MQINPKDIIAPAFHPLFDDVYYRKHTHYWLKGGRGSCKSSFVSIMIVLGILESYLKYRDGTISQAELSNAICFRKVGATIRNSLASQIQWAINELHLNGLFRENASVFEFVFKPTGQKIILTGIDDPQKIKSIKPRVGYFQRIWFEELAEFDSMEEIRTVLQSVLRGGDDFTVFYSYNPPLVRQNWVNFEAGVTVPNRIVHHSTYQDVPTDWLGESFIQEAELLKQTKPLAYEHEYLGVPTGTGGSVFDNLEIRTITDDEIKRFDKIRQGIDWGFSIDPVAFVRVYFDSTRKILYFIDEIYGTHIFNKELMTEIERRGYKKDVIIADSEESKSVSEFWYNGFMCYGAKKGAGSIAYGMKFLQGLNKIVIDQARTPNAYKEFMLYEYEKNKDGSFKSIYPDKNNHCLVGSTLITTDKGRKQIKNVKVGDYVLTRDGFHRVAWSGVTGRNMKVYTVTTATGRTLTGTDNHKIFVDKGFHPLRSLRRNQLLITEHNDTITNGGDLVTSIAYAGYATEVYDLTIETKHEFFANGILVHNCIDSVRYALENDMEKRGVF